MTTEVSQMADEIVIVPEYQDMIDPLLDEELALLEAGLTADGCRDALVLSHGRLLDGHNRLAICRRLGIAFKTIDLALPDEATERDWIINNQLGRRNLHPSQKSYLRGKQYKAEKKSEGAQEGNKHAAKQLAQNDPVVSSPTSTAERLAERHSVSPATIKRDEEWADSVDTLKEAGIAAHRVIIEDFKPKADAIEFAKHLADAVPEVIEAVKQSVIPISIAAQLVHAPADVQREAVANPQRAKSIAHNHRALGTGENEWYTPAEHLEAAREVLGGIDLDPASSPLANETVGASRIFTAEDNGLEQEWRGRVWLNPPYSQPAISQFAEKLASEWEAGRVQSAIALTHNYTDTGWFHRLASSCRAICFTRGRIGFVNPEGKKAAPTQGQAFFYFGQDAEQFIERFGNIGFVVEVRG